MQVNIYPNSNGTFTVNAYDNNGFLVGAISTAGGSGVKAEDAVQFIDSLRNQNPEDVRARVMLDNEAIQLNMFSNRKELIHTLNACLPVEA